MVYNLKVIVTDCNRVRISVNNFREANIHNISHVGKFHSQVATKLLIHISEKFRF